MPRKPVVSAIVTLAAVGVGGYLVFGSGAQKHTVTGDLSLSATSTSSLSAGDSCAGQNGYGDISGGAEVDITNESGTTLATSTLNDGTYDGTNCVFTFSLSDVPKAKFYRVRAGNSQRSGPQYSFSDMQSSNWSVHLTLGDG